MAISFFEALHHSGIPALAKLLPRKRLLVLNFHRVGDDPSDFHDGMIETNSMQFQSHIDWLSNHVRWVGESELGKLKHDGQMKALLTFDDGYVDAIKVIAPILERRGIPAIFFIAPKIIDKRILGAWDHIAYLVKKFRGSEFEFRGKKFSLSEGTRPVYLELGEMSQRTLPDQGEEFVAELATVLNLELPSLTYQSRELLTWDQVRDLQRRGFGIGGHGYSHRVLSSLSIDEQEEEVRTGRDRLTAEKIVTKSFAYPFGSPESYSWETREAAINAGYEYVFSFGGSTSKLSKLNPKSIDRVAFKSSIAKYDFLVSFPALHNLLYGMRQRREQW